LAAGTATADTLPLPKKLAGVEVTVGDLEVAAPLFYVSPGQINALIPFEALGQTLPLFVTTDEGRSAPFLLQVSASGPGLFTTTGDGKGPAVILDASFRPLETAAAGKPMILYATGLGPTDPPAASGAPGALVEPLNRVVNIPEVYIGEAPAVVDFAGLAPGLAGVYQLNVIPRQLASDRLFIRSQGRMSNIVSVKSIVQGGNVANAAGTIQLIYPSSDPAAPPAGYSPLFIAAKFTARMDILPSAGPFVIAAVSDAAASIITVDPVNGVYEGSATLPTMPSRVGDFSGAEFQPVDFAACFGDTCQPFPGGIVPASRISPFELTALNQVPLPDTMIPNSSTGVRKYRGSIRPGTSFAIDDQNNSALSIFAGYLTLPTPPRPGTASVKLYVDGRLVASADIAYRVLTF
jgi:uncharacterized protein (TIGR03437 family)